MHEGLVTKVTPEDVEALSQFRQNQMRNINKIFTNIRNLLKSLATSELLLAGIYTDLNVELREFEDRLSAEASLVNLDNYDPLLTAQKLEQVVEHNIDPNHTLKHKINNIENFRNDCRHSKFSKATVIASELVVGVLRGALLMSTLMIFSCMLANLPPPFLPFAAAIGAIIGSVGGIVHTVSSSKEKWAQHDDSRGLAVCNNLKTLIKERSKYFTSNHSNQTKGIEETPTNKAQPGFYPSLA
jgi:hypothetical protein